MGPWTVTRSSLRKLRRVDVARTPVGPVLIASFVCVCGAHCSVFWGWSVLLGLSSIHFLPWPWTATRSSLRKLPLVVTACWAMGLACVAPFACEWGPIIGLLGLLPMMLGWFLCERGPGLGPLVSLRQPLYGVFRCWPSSL